MTRRIIALLLAVAMLLSFAVVAGAETAGAVATIRVEEATMRANEEKLIGIRVTPTDSTTGIRAVQFRIDYDKSNLELESFVTETDDGTFAGASFGSCTASADTGSIPWTDTKNLRTNLTFIWAKFKVKETAAVGEYPISIHVLDESTNYVMTTSVKSGDTVEDTRRYANEVEFVDGKITVVAPNVITLNTTEVAAPTWAETSNGTKSFDIASTFGPTAYDKNGAVANGVTWTYAIKGVPVGQESMIQLSEDGSSLVLNSHVEEGTQFTLTATAAAANTFDSESISQDFAITVTKKPRVLSRLSLYGLSSMALPTKTTPTSADFSLSTSDQYDASMTLTETPEYTLRKNGETEALVYGTDYKVSGTTLTLNKTDSVTEGLYYLYVKVGDVSSEGLTINVTKATSVATKASITMADADKIIEIPTGEPVEKSFTVEVRDQYGEPMSTGYEVTGSGVEGVSIENGKVKVTAAAKGAVAKGETGTYTISVMANGAALATQPVTIKRAESKVTSWIFTVNGTEVDGKTAYVTVPADGSEILVTAVVTFLDQYGEKVDTLEEKRMMEKDDFCSFGKHDISFHIKAQTLTFTKSDVTPVTVEDLAKLNLAKYGMTWAEIVTINKDIAVTAKVGSTPVEGEFSVANPDAKPNAGEQTYTIVFNSTDGKYKNVTVVTDTVDVAQKLLNITKTDPTAPISKVYDATTDLTAENKTAIQDCISLNGVVEGDEVYIDWSTVTASYDSKDVAEVKEINVTIPAASLRGKDAGNYQMTAGTTTLSVDATITPRSLNDAKVTLDKTSVEYAGDPVELPTPTVTLGDMTLTQGTDYQAVSYIVGTGWTDVGTYSYTIEPVTGNQNFTGNASATFTIVPAKLTVTAEAKSKTYGDADPELTYKVDGLKAPDQVEDVLSGSLTRADGENAGSYDITQGTLSANKNYTLTFVPAKLTINPAALTVTPEAKSKTYGETDPELTYTVSGLKNSDKAETVLTGALSRVSGENVGEYTIQQGTLEVETNGRGSKNYTLTVVDTVKLTINKASQEALQKALEEAVKNGMLTVQRAHEGKLEIGASFLGNTAAVSVVHNEEFETATAEYANGKITLTAKAKDQATLGATTILLKVSNAKNYEGEATVTVNAKITEKTAQAVTFTNAGPLTASYAQATLTNPATAKTALTYASSDSTVATVDANGTVTFVKPGTVTITASAAETTDYAPASNSYTLTVSKAVVTVSVSSASMTAGQTVPTFTPVVTGLNPKDSNIFRVLSATAATDGKTAGTYTVMISAILKDEWKDYYDVRVLNGLLTVNPAGSIIDTILPILTGGSACEYGYADCACQIFTDLDATRWYHAPIDWAYNLGLMSGTSATTFSPNAAATRAMTWTMLARIAGQDTRRSSTWYEVGQTWAVAQGITDGTNPMGTITREQLAAMLYRYVGSPAVSGKLTFADSASVSSWAQDAMLWAVQNGILDGVGGNRLNPKGNTTRAQAAAIFQRFSK